MPEFKFIHVSKKGPRRNINHTNVDYIIIIIYH